MLLDSHAHVQFPSYDKNREEVIKRARLVGVKMLCVGTQYGTSLAAVELAEKYPEEIWASIGFHPNHVAPVILIRQPAEKNLKNQSWYHDSKEQKEFEPEVFDIEKFRELATHPKVVAMGECGLDYYRIRNDESVIKELQKEVFIAQANLANEFKKALMIHCRPSKGTDNAYEDLLKLPISNFKLPKILHFYVGNLNITKKLVEAGFYFTFGGVITFSRDYDEVIKYIPMDCILLETDAPYVAPEPYRGKQNEPAYILETAKKMAEIKNMSYKDIASKTTDNALQIFKIA